LLAGVFVIFAAGLAYYGAVSAAIIQSKAILDQANAQAEAKRAHDDGERNLARANFKMAVYLAAHHLRNDLRANKGVMAAMIQTQGAVTPDSLHEPYPIKWLEGPIIA
jgi:hypothetical protein